MAVLSVCVSASNARGHVFCFSQEKECSVCDETIFPFSICARDGYILGTVVHNLKIKWRFFKICFRELVDVVLCTFHRKYSNRENQDKAWELLLLVTKE